MLKLNYKFMNLGVIIKKKRMIILQDKVFIVTGANGFLGNNIVRILLERGLGEVRALVLPNDKLQSLKDLNCKIYRGDVRDVNTLNDIFDVNNKEIYVIHCAAIVYIKSKYNKNVYDVNFNGSKNFINKVLEKNCKLVYVSSVHAIPEAPNKQVITEIKDFNPDKVEGIYAKSKALTANYVLKMVKENNLNATIVHPSGIIGPGDFGNSHLTQLIMDFASGRLKACVNGGYDFVDVRDVALGVINACFNGEKGECYILSNRFVSIKELLDNVSEIRNSKRVNTILPMWFAKLTAPFSEIYYAILKQPPLYTKYSLFTLTSNSNFSNAKAKKFLDYKTRDLKETISDTINWLKNKIE